MSKKKPKKPVFPIYEFVQVYMATAKGTGEVHTVADVVAACRTWTDALQSAQSQ